MDAEGRWSMLRGRRGGRVPAFMVVECRTVESVVAGDVDQLEVSTMRLIDWGV